MNQSQPPAALPTPPLGVRLAGMLYETLLVAAVLAVFYLLPQMVYGMVTQATVPTPVARLHFVGLLLLYFVGFWRAGGQTLAMKTWRVRLVSARGGPPTAAQAILRFCWAWPSILLLGAGIAWALFDRDGQFLHDRLAETRLVRLPKVGPDEK